MPDYEVTFSKAFKVRHCESEEDALRMAKEMNRKGSGISEVKVVEIKD